VQASAGRVSGTPHKGGKQLPRQEAVETLVRIHRMTVAGSDGRIRRGNDEDTADERIARRIGSCDPLEQQTAARQRGEPPDQTPHGAGRVAITPIGREGAEIERR